LLTQPSIEKLILQYLGTGYTDANVTPYINANFTSQGMLIPQVRSNDFS